MLFNLGERPYICICMLHNVMHVLGFWFHSYASCRERFSGVLGENGARSPLGEMLNNNDDDDKPQSETDTHVSSTNDDSNDKQQVVAIHSNIDNPIPGDVKEQIEEQGCDQEMDPPTSTSEATWQYTPSLNLDSQDPVDEWGGDSEAAVEETCGSDYVGTSYDWFTDISRPRSYWEDRRQTWYQEMLDSNSANDEIRRLIKRYTIPVTHFPNFTNESAFVSYRTQVRVLC